MKKYIKIMTLCLVALMLVMALSSCSQSGHPRVSIEIEGYGTMVVELYEDQAPITVAHFKKLVKNFEKDNSFIIRHHPEFVLQAVLGSDTETIKGEFSTNGVKNDIKHEKGVISMARATGNDTASNQFFIVTATTVTNTLALDGYYAAFGKVVEGLDIIDKIAADLTTDKFINNMGFLAEKDYIKITNMTLTDTASNAWWIILIVVGVLAVAAVVVILIVRDRKIKQNRVK